MAHRMLRDAEADGWERSDFPIICESCLGDNPYVRMTKANFDKECKICTRPFTVFRWRPGREARYKKTEVCQTCSKLKNVCQVCLLDLEYGLPVQVRDTALGLENDAIPKSDVNREFFAEEADRKAKSGQDFDASHGRAKPNDLILKLQRTTPYYKRNRAHICSFFVRGECTRGAECPYRHEMPVEGPLAHQNLKDRFYGVNDPVAAKLLQKAGEMPSLAPPEDQAIMTLYVGGLDTRVTETDLRDQFYGWGEIAGIKLVPTKQCAFVTYTSREGAEKAAENLANKLVIKGLRLRLMWGKPHMQKGEDGGAGGPSRPPPTSVIRAGLLPRAILPTQQMAQQQQQVGVGSQVHPAEPPPPAAAPVNYFNMPPPPPAAIAAATAGNEQAYYPSMDPEQMGAARAKAGDDNAAGGSSLSGPSAPQRPLPPPRPFLPPSYGPGPPPPYPNSQANQQQVAPPGVAPSHYGYGQNESTEQQQQYFQPLSQQELPPGYSQPSGMQPPMAGMAPPPPPGMMPRGYHQQFMSRPQYYSRGNY